MKINLVSNKEPSENNYPNCHQVEEYTLTVEEIFTTAAMHLSEENIEFLLDMITEHLEETNE